MITIILLIIMIILIMIIILIIIILIIIQYNTQNKECPGYVLSDAPGLLHNAKVNGAVGLTAAITTIVIMIMIIQTILILNSDNANTTTID